MNPLAGLERTVGKDMFHKVRKLIDFVNQVVCVVDRPYKFDHIGMFLFCFHHYLYKYKVYLSHYYFPKHLYSFAFTIAHIHHVLIYRYKHRTSFVSEQEVSVVNFSKIWLYQAFGEFK